MNSTGSPPAPGRRDASRANRPSGVNHRQWFGPLLVLVRVPEGLAGRDPGRQLRPAFVSKSPAVSRARSVQAHLPRKRRLQAGGGEGLEPLQPFRVPGEPLGQVVRGQPAEVLIDREVHEDGGRGLAVDLVVHLHPGHPRDHIEVGVVLVHGRVAVPQAGQHESAGLGHRHGVGLGRLLLRPPEHGNEVPLLEPQEAPLELVETIPGGSHFRAVVGANNERPVVEFVIEHQVASRTGRARDEKEGGQGHGPGAHEFSPAFITRGGVSRTGLRHRPRGATRAALASPNHHPRTLRLLQSITALHFARRHCRPAEPPGSADHFPENLRHHSRVPGKVRLD